MAKTIVYVSKDKCTGCGACYNICPHKAIEMVPDEEGFISPKLKGDLCTQCGMCLRCCPATTSKHTATGGKHIYAARLNREVQDVSSSGGIFSLLASYVRDEKGYVVGAAFEDGYTRVKHRVIAYNEDLQPIRKSKYLQSETGDTFQEVRRILNEGRTVLFSGCPCQTAGLKAFLGKEYDNLLLVDIICHGTPSPKAYNAHIAEIANGRTVSCVDFREKTFVGWGTPLTITFDNGEIYRENCANDLFYRGFLNGLNTRRCCAVCPYATPFTHESDITLGDFWGIREIDPESHDDYGVNLVLTNTSKGESFLQNAIKKSRTPVYIKEQNMKKSIELAKTRNGQFIAPRTAHWARERFFSLLSQKKYSQAFEMAVNSKYDVGIVGWWNNANYGGMLTYYALYSFIKSLNLSPLMIRHIRWDSEKTPQTDSIMYRFAQKHYHISRNYEKHDLYLLNNQVRCFISGSDQLFNPYLWQYSGKEYFLQFVSNKNKKISYASSFGNRYFSTNPYHMEIAYYLQRFDSLSVREDYAVDICKDNFGLDVQHVVDPVFLCDPFEFHKLAQDVTVQDDLDKPYFVGFILDPSEEKRQLLLSLEQKLNRRSYILIDPDNSTENAKKMNLSSVRPDVEVEQWLAYYRSADYIVTDSFHGTCFAIVFQKPFVTIANPARGNRRMESILRMAGLSDRLVYQPTEEEVYQKLMEPIDFEQVKARMLPHIEESRTWLKNAIFEDDINKTSPFKLLDEQVTMWQTEYSKKLAELENSILAKTAKKKYWDRLKPLLQKIKKCIRLKIPNQLKRLYQKIKG